jgi:hypothetical protein
LFPRFAIANSSLPRRVTIYSSTCSCGTCVLTEVAGVSKVHI